MELDCNGLEVLTSDECLRLLRSQTLGRIALSSGALPVVLPVNFVVLDERILIRTRNGTRLARAAQNAVVAFEVDQFDAVTGEGWSVMVQGFARHVEGQPDLVFARDAPLARWLDPRDSMHVEVSIDIVSGRRVQPDTERHTLDVEASSSDSPVGAVLDDGVR